MLKQGGIDIHKRLKKVLLIFTLILFIFNLSACGNKYNEFDSAFMSCYYEIIQNIDSEKVEDILFKLQSKENLEILAGMDNLLKENKEPRRGNEKGYDELQALYMGLMDLKDAYKKWESYDLDKQQYLNTQLNNIYVNLSLLETNRKNVSK